MLMRFLHPGLFGILLATACSDPSGPPIFQQEPLPPPILLQIGAADTAYNDETTLQLSGSTGRLRLEGTVSLPGPNYTLDLSGTRLGFDITINLLTVEIPGSTPESNLSGRSLAAEWELPEGTYRIIVQDAVKSLKEQAVVVD
jgi:hypothetical protein